MNTLNWSVRQYNQWLLEKIHGYDTQYSDFSKLLDLLSSIDYVYYAYHNGSDKDRYRDGLNLRNIYSESTDDFYILSWAQDCSVLEMLIALAIKIDFGIMGIPNKDNAYYWFWLMLENLGLIKFSDKKFDEHDARKIISDWLYRDIDFNGSGGIFPLKISETDQRNESTWSQLNYYINERG